MRKKVSSYISEEDSNNILTMEMVLQDTDETFSQSCMRYGHIPDNDLLLSPMQDCTLALCEDNPKLKKRSLKHGIKDLLRMKIYSDLTNKLLKS